MMFRKRVLLFWLTIHLAALLFLAPATSGEETQATFTEDARPVTLEDLQKQIKEVEEDKQLDDESRVKLLDVLRKMLAELENQKRLAAAIQELARTIQSAPNLIVQCKRELESSTSSEPQVAGMSLRELEQQLLQHEAELDKLEKSTSDANLAPKRRDERRVKIPERLAEIKQKIEEVDKQLLAAPTDTLLAEAHRRLLVARKTNLATEATALERERQSYDATAELLTLQHRLAVRRRDAAKQHVKLLAEEVNLARTVEAQRQVREARRVAAESHPSLREFAVENSSLAKRRGELSTEIKSVSTEIEATKSRLKILQGDYQRVSERLNQAGLNDTFGSLLHRRREELPNPRECRNRIAARRTLIQSIQLAIYELEERRARFAETENRMRHIVDELTSESQLEKRELLNATVEELLQGRVVYRDDLLTDYDRYFRQVVELDSLDRELVDETEKFGDFIDERVLWVPSTTPVDMADANLLLATTARFLSAERWQDWAAGVWDHLVRHPVVSSVLLLLMIPFAFRRRMRRRLAALGEIASDEEQMHFGPTLTAFGLTFALAAMWPAVIYCFGWSLVAPSDATSAAYVFGSALQVTAVFLFALDLMRHVCRPLGLATSHFAWDEEQTVQCGRRLRYVVWLGVPLVLLIATLQSQSADRGLMIAGRTIFVFAALLLAAGLPALVRPLGPLLQDMLAQPEDGLLHRSRWYWATCGWIVIGFIAGLSLWGYYYTAVQLTWRMFGTFCIGVGVLLAHAMLVRWLFLAQRRLAAIEAQEHAEQQAIMAAAETDPAADANANSNYVTSTTDDVDLWAVRLEIRRLVSYATLAAGAVLVWAVWNDVLPAMRFVEEYAVIPGSEGALPVTVGNIAAAAIAILATFIVTKIVPSLLEMTVLHRTQLDAGARFAVTTISRYIVCVIGLVLACRQVGFGWLNVQWLVAAMTVGLGFGLQEIFANFVSGLILLLERPIRVGDVVTVGDVSGVVARIRMRATTIRNWDRKELVVPNKEFITGRLLNWTLSDQTNRLLIEVGVAYGSDVDRARELLLKVATEHPLILDDPQPIATLECFADSALTFTLRAFLPNLDNRLAVVHELHAAIDREFRDNGITIAFPQLDMHVRSLESEVPAATAPPATKGAA